MALLKVATVLTVYGIETTEVSATMSKDKSLVATVLTVYGIETLVILVLVFSK